MNNIPSEAYKIIEEAKTNDEFVIEYSNHLIGIGERSVDYSVYQFDFPEGYCLIIDFVDFSFESYSLINRNHHRLISQIIEETTKS